MTDAPVPNDGSADEEEVTYAGVAIYNTNPGVLTNEYTERMYSLLLHNVALGDEGNLLTDIHQQPSGACVAAQRDGGMMSFLRTNAEWILWLDSDIGFEPTLLQQFMEVADPIDAPIICGLYVTMLDDVGVSPCAWLWDDDIPFGKSPLVPLDAEWTAKQREDGVRLVEVATTGAGCLLIHRSVIIKMANYYGAPAPWFHEDIVHGVQFGEDFSFCTRARSLGYKVHVDLGITTTHEKHIFLHPDHLGKLQVANPHPTKEEGIPT